MPFIVGTPLKRKESNMGGPNRLDLTPEGALKNLDF